MNRVGVDVVHIPGFVERMAVISSEAVFSPEELRLHVRPESRAGAFAAKEAFFKATGHQVDWKSVSVLKQSNGRPYFSSALVMENEAIDLSISHDGDYAVAVVVVSNAH